MSSHFLNHLKSHLSDGSGTSVTCPYDDCDKSFSVRSSFSSHLSRKHRDTCTQNLSAAVVHNGEAEECHSFDKEVASGNDCIHIC